MSDPFFFGEPSRALFGILHAYHAGPQPGRGARRACLVCPPLLQDAMRSQRALWQLSDMLAEGRCDVLRFDWHGTGESMGESTDLRLEGMLADIEAALRELSLASQPDVLDIVALRSAALPVLAHASASRQAVRLVLWDPVLDGAALVENWRRQQQEQLSLAGRYPLGVPAMEPGELMGYDVDDALLQSLSAIDHGRVELPAGTHVTLAAWDETPDLEAFIAHQRRRGIEVECLWLEPAERPVFDQPRMFETQLLPRRSVGMLARKVAGVAA